MFLALNTGSSSVKFALAEAGAEDAPLLAGRVDRLGTDRATLSYRDASAAEAERALPQTDIEAALTAVFDLVSDHLVGRPLRAVAHRIVHGGADLSAPVEATPEIAGKLRALVPLAPLHQPAGLAGLDAARARYPEALQVAVFDTAFHVGKPWVNDAMALPRHFHDEGLRRYGFHGIACASVTETLREEGYPLDARKIVIAHLGSGASVTAVAEGRAIACSMGFSALDGLTMGTRPGNLDPGVILHLMRMGYGVEALEDLLYRKSGLLGLSGMSADMRDLEAADTEAARQAIAHFVARAVQEIARMAGAMGGLDAVVFSGGIGENAGHVRDAVAEGLAFLPGNSGEGVEFLVRAADEESQLLKAASRFA